MLSGVPESARCVQRFDDSLEICNSHYISRFAAFFIDARAKRSVAESCNSVVYTFWPRYVCVCGPADPLARTSGRCVHKCVCVCDKDVRSRATVQRSIMILPQVHLRKPCYDFYFL